MYTPYQLFSCAVVIFARVCFYFKHLQFFLYNICYLNYHPNSSSSPPPSVHTRLSSRLWLVHIRTHIHTLDHSQIMPAFVVLEWYRIPSLCYTIHRLPTCCTHFICFRSLKFITQPRAYSYHQQRQHQQLPQTSHHYHRHRHQHYFHHHHHHSL